MASMTRAAPHLSAAEVKTRLLQDPRPWYRQRWLIRSNALVDPRAASEIAKHTGTTLATVHQGIASYNRLGVAAVAPPGKGGRRRKSLSWEEEQDCLAPFFSRAERGDVATAGESQQACEARVGHQVHQSTLSRLLKRHRWRKPVPRPLHPKASPDAQAAFKQPSPAPLRRLSRHVQPLTNARSSRWRVSEGRGFPHQ